MASGTEAANGGLRTSRPETLLSLLGKVVSKRLYFVEDPDLQPLNPCDCVHSAVALALTAMIRRM